MTDATETAHDATETADDGDRAIPAWARLRFDWRTVGVVALVALVFALPLRALLRYQGPPMEEGFMLVFPERVLRGDVPHRDFLHLYGPGSLWALALWYKVLGVSITAERLFGAAQLGAIVAGVMALARPWGRKVVLASGVVGVLLTTTAIGLTALAWDGAVALAVAGLWVGLRARRWVTAAPGLDPGLAERRAARLFVLSGVLAGFALLFRPDLIVGVTLGTAGMLAGLGRARQGRWAVGAALGVVPYLVHLAISGPGHAIDGMLIQPVFELRGGRSLPQPPSWDHFDGALQKVASLRVPDYPLPAMAAEHQAFIWFFLLPVVTLFVVGVGWWRVRAEPDRWQARVLLAVGLLGLGMMPQAFQRPDTTHLAWVSCVPLAFLPAALSELFDHLPPRVIRRHAPTLASVAVLLVPLLLLSSFTTRTWLDLARQSRSGDVFGYPVDHDGRRFYLGSPEVAQVAQRMLDQVGPELRPGQRLFVGTADLRKTPYSDAYLYYLLPDLRPGTRYIEMDPGMANAPGSGLAHEVATSDWLILSHVWDNWQEPNDSRVFGPDGPNAVVRKDFCQVGDFGPYFEVFMRLPAGAVGRRPGTLDHPRARTPHRGTACR
jgi:hypothetical protein